jgi:AraC family transcriptional regulator
MNLSQNGTSVPAVAALGARLDPSCLTKIVGDEPCWRAFPSGSEMDSTGPTVRVTRWQAAADTQEFAAETSDDSHVVMIILRSMNIRLLVAGRTVQDGVATPGTLLVIQPGVSVRGMFCGPFDVLRLHVPNSLIAECAGGISSRQKPSLAFHVAPARDRTVERLGRALLGAEQFGGPCGYLYANCIGIAIVARLLATGRTAASRKRASVAKLPQWRLKRAIEYVEARLVAPKSKGGETDRSSRERGPKARTIESGD